MYLAQSTYDAIQADPSKVVTYYNSTRSIFISDLEMSGLSENAVIAAWCSVVAYGLSAYGPGPQTLDLSVILQSPTIACHHYITLTWHLYRQFGLSDDNLTAIGWDNGAVGNHAQMLYSDGVTNLLVDPTIALIVTDVIYNDLVYGQSYHDYKSFYSRSDITFFNNRVIEAITSGSYKISDAIYKVPGFDNWLYHYNDYIGITIEHGNQSQTIVGYLTGDTIDAGPGNDIVYGGKGKDWINGGAGVDLMYGGLDNDYFYVDHVGDRVFEFPLEGIDQVYESLDYYTIPENVENVYIQSLATANVLGNNSNNLFYAGSGNNIINGSGGNDTICYYYATASVSVKLSYQLSQNTGGSGWDTLISIENLQGSNFNDLLMGDSSNNVILGYAGDDALNGLAGADWMFGEDGSDRYYVHNTGDRVVEKNANSVSGGVDTVYSYLASYTLPSNVENGYIMSKDTASLTGNSLNNLFYAGSGNNLLNGSTGIDTVSYTYGVTGTRGVTVSLAVTTAQATGGSDSDTLMAIENLTGSSFADTLTGNAGANVLNGGAGVDILNGGAGADTLIGGADQDTLIGGSGNDIFDFNALSESGVTSDTWDVIKDFVSGQDKIDLSTIDANQDTTADDAFTTLLIDASMTFTAVGQLKLSGDVLYANTDADFSADFAIQLTGITSLTMDDFIV